MRDIYLITTTIHVPTVLERYRDIANESGSNLCKIIVAGDKNTPADTEKFCLTDDIYDYLSVAEQCKYSVSDTIGWNCIMRRNMALLRAIEMSDNDDDIIITIDDDNYPLDMDYFLDIEFTLVGTTSGMMVSPAAPRGRVGWFNIGDFFTPKFYHRGFPYSQRKNPMEYNLTYASASKIGIAAGLWLGDPDIDAMERIIHAPIIQHEPSLLSDGVTIHPSILTPTNSQNTAFPAKLAPLMAVWPWVGRYDDIWASYLAQRIMHEHDYLVHFGAPFCYQSRNSHNLFKNLKDEMFGMEHTDELIRALCAAPTPKNKDIGIIDRYEQMISNIEGTIGSWDFPNKKRLLDFFQEWIKDVQVAEKSKKG